ncbi:MAG: response regulator transcription factor [Burkholderiaceae bacterium]
MSEHETRGSAARDASSTDAVKRQVLLVDDHPLVLDGMTVLIESMDPDAVVLCARTLEEAFDLAQANPGIDLTLLDLGLPGCTAATALERYRASFPENPVVVLSGVDDPALMLGSLERGAMGFIQKTADRDELAAALRRVIAGEIYIPANAVIGVKPQHPRNAAEGMDLDEAAAKARRSIDEMTPRRREVLRLLLRGHTNKLIARELGLSDNTVKIHVSAVLHAIGVANRTQAVFVASRAGFKS